MGRQHAKKEQELLCVAIAAVRVVDYASQGLDDRVLNEFEWEQMHHLFQGYINMVCIVSQKASSSTEYEPSYTEKDVRRAIADWEGGIGLDLERVSSLIGAFELARCLLARRWAIHWEQILF
ncbi:hypothetical protein ACJZ2D_017229 [Fusarium nematophilum]